MNAAADMLSNILLTKHTWSDTGGDMQLTPALRRRRQTQDKYVTDASQLPLRFTRPQERRNIRSRYDLMLLLLFSVLGTRQQQYPNSVQTRNETQCSKGLTAVPTILAMWTLLVS